MNLSLRQIRAFTLIARLQSITRAAEQLHISQAGLSGMLRDIETQLDCRLFDRTTRAVSLTDAGRAFLPVATRVLAELEGAAASLGRLSAAESQTLVIGATPLVASCVLPLACAAFAAQRPQTSVVVQDLDRAQIRQKVQAGELDAGYGVFLEAAGDLRRMLLQMSELVLVAPQGAALPGTGERLRWSELRDLALLSLPADNPIQQQVDAQLASIGRSQPSQRTFNHLHTVLAMVEAGAGHAVLPSFVASASLRYRLQMVPLTRPRVALEFYEITRKGRPRGSALAAFSQCLLAAMSRASD
ncbi:LysR family transcriptional regulator [Variovorax sp. RA8]|uniref:LysR family transcriptional regulator n=1 Tax=Variovorax sp. (strain JCM 16519 / RA8) TaxID=662548 RepID=UPI0013172DF2|nr:LysR family transcriptional regulator [Variovorax sp. RA8]VTU38336.1 Cyn operon transcriptional activator [Variovorax sp. RA8]